MNLVLNNFHRVSKAFFALSEFARLHLSQVELNLYLCQYNVFFLLENNHKIRELVNCLYVGM